MKLLLASSEVHPYSKTGGLADMVGALAKSVAREGHKVSLITPLYAGIREKLPQLKPTGLKLELPLGARTVPGDVWSLSPIENLTIYFLDQPEFFFRHSPYLQPDGISYPDNDERFIFFSKAVVHLARHELKPDLIHVHDWQVGFVPLLMHHEQLAAGWGSPPPTILTIHNLAYQGTFPAWRYVFTNLPWDYFNPDGAEFYGQMNCLKAGIAHANLVTTVSPRYAREITTPEYGCGLEGLLLKRQDSLIGILNGVDFEEWSTTHNPYLRHPYSIDDLSGKIANKLDLQKELGLPANKDIPLFGNISRLIDQKGVDILLGALEEMLSADMQFVVLGTGDAAYENAYRDLALRYPTKVAARIGFNQGLSQRIEAGCDFFTMPSRYEPCGLNQMYSLHYGTVPIVRVTGGLDDSVIDIAEGPDHADGIKFTEYTSSALAKGIRKALALYAEPELMMHYRLNGMTVDFSWEKTARKYSEVYENILKPALKPAATR
ncbi:MAG TPA: glycogen synthase GlgA [Verrucomicrobiae bacterium]|jgi:starch synthase|nr:glycogen synthase GlgA [Verrucomicrobiae bacterium]